MQEWYKFHKLGRATFLFIFLLVLSSFTFAIPPVQTNTIYATNILTIDYPKIDYIKSGEKHIFNFHVYDVNLTPLTNISNISCYFHLYDNAGDHLVEDKKIYFDSASTMDFYDNYTFTKVGAYSYLIQCNKSNYGGFASVPFIVTDTGTDKINFDFNIYYFGLAFAIFIMVLGFWKQDYTFISFSGLVMLIFGVFLLINGYNNQTNLITLIIGSGALGIGAYVFIKSSWDILEK